MKKISTFLIALAMLTACGTVEKVQETKVVETKEIVKVATKPVSTIFRREVKNLKADADLLDVKLTWTLDNLEEVGKIEIYKKILPKGEFEKVADLEGASKETIVKLDKLEEVMFKVKVLSIDGRESYGRTVKPLLIFAATENFFNE